MIESVRYENYQAHKDTLLEFDKGVNVIIGTSDSGKSSLIRGIRWSSKNKPNGLEIIRHKQKEAKVTIVNNGEEVIRTRSKTKNIYKTAKDTYAGFNADVPEDVLQIFNMADINLQKQMDAPFLLSETPGEISRYVNRVAKLDKMDVSMKYLAATLTKVKQKSVIVTSALSTLKSKKEAMGDIEAMEALVVAGEAVQGTIESSQSIYLKLSDFVMSLKIDKVSIEDNGTDKLINEKALSLSIKQDEIEAGEYKLANLLGQTNFIKGNMEEQSTEKDLLYVNNGLTIANSLDEQGRILNTLERLLFSMKQDNTDLKRRSKAVKLLKDKYHEEFPDICPFCGK